MEVKLYTVHTYDICFPLKHISYETSLHARTYHEKVTIF